MVHRTRAFSYAVLFLSCVTAYLLWRDGALPRATQVFMACYGLHAAGTLAATIFLLVESEFLPFKKRLLTVAAVGVYVSIISLGGELAQYYQPDRVVDIWDVVAQEAGVATAVLVYLVVGPVYVRS